MEVEDEHHVLTHAPKSSHSYKNSVHGLQKITNKFTFSKIYGQETNQKEFFNGTMLGTVKNFIDGQNCLVFSYGVTSSGKTYTTYFHYRKQEKLPPMKPKSLQSKSSYLEMYEKTKAKRQKKCQPKSATKRVHFRDPV